MLCRSRRAVRQQLTEVRVAGRVGSPDDDRRSIDWFEVGSDHKLDARLFRCPVGPHDPLERGPVGEREGVVAEGRSPRD